jgi:lipoate-protein ligase B
MLVRDLGLLPYRDAWRAQEEAHAQALASGEEQLLLVEHPPVITLGRRPGARAHLVARDEALAAMGVEVVQSDRGGDITFHGPGQVVAYPIVRLIAHRLSVGSYVQRLLDAVVGTLEDLGVAAQKDRAAIGVWVERDGRPHKICALGVRIKRGVSLHGVALNVTTDLRFFDLIVPCGLKERGVTSLGQVMGQRCPTLDRVKEALAARMMRALERTS